MRSATTRWVLVAGALVVVVSTSITGASSGVAAESGAGPHVSLGRPLLPAAAIASTKHPAHNIPPSPNYFDVCVTKGYNNPQCIKQELAAIRHARSHEHMKQRAMILPRNYRHLSVAEQTFVITDLERVDRGLRPFQGLSATLDKTAKAAAELHLDLTLATGTLKSLHIDSYGSNWAGDIGPLSADYDWMYNDGYAKTGGINVACVKPSDDGCWGHRANILWPYDQPRLLAGAATATPAGASIAEVLTAGTGAAPKFDYTWKAALRHGAGGHRVKAQH